MPRSSFKSLLVVATCLTLAACDRQSDTSATVQPTKVSVQSPETSTAAASSTAGKWDLQSSDEGVALALMSSASDTVMRLFCPAGSNQLVVNVPGFKPIASEERLSFGSGGEAMALVADPKGDNSRGGVTGKGEVPANLAALAGGGVSASYGAQKSGPYATPDPALVRSFVSACQERKTEKVTQIAPVTVAAGDACMVQDGKRLAIAPLRALGTEPFWGANIKGRCVTYSHPENPTGTRIWTSYAATADGGRWSGSLDGRKFELTTRKAPGCSDGMSDNSFPLAASLAVNGEQRKGCAKPI